jgi:hypothetical protein
VTTDDVTRDQLRDAVIAADRVVHERPEGDILTHFVVVTSYRSFDGDDAMDDEDCVSLLFPPGGMATWQALGLLRTGQLGLEDRVINGDKEG